MNRFKNSITINSIIATQLMDGLTAQWLGLNEYEGYCRTERFLHKLKSIKVGSDNEKI